jgi:hypothetical protein
MINWGASAQGAVVGGTGGITTGTATTAATGSGFWVGILTSGTTPVISSVTDNKGNGNYPQIGTRYSDGGGIRLDEFLLPSGAGGAGMDWLVSYGGVASYGTAFAVEITGMAATSPQDQRNLNTANASPPLNSGNIVLTPPASGELILVLFSTEIGTAWTYSDSGNPGTAGGIIQSQLNGALSNPTGLVAGVVVTSPGTYNANVSDGGGVFRRAVIIDSFLGASSSGTPGGYCYNEC